MRLKGDGTASVLCPIAAFFLLRTLTYKLKMYLQRR